MIFTIFTVFMILTYPWVCLSGEEMEGLHDAVYFLDEALWWEPAYKQSSQLCPGIYLNIIQLIPLY